MTITDLSILEHAGPGVGITDTCGLCCLSFDLMYEPDQYPTLPNDMGDPEELICDACQDLMEADPLAVLRASLVADGWTAESPDKLDDDAERLAKLERQS
jgi:hypothetical protein